MPTESHQFLFDLDAAIRSQVVEALEKSPAIKLAKSVGPQESGIYALYHKNELVYIGKATKEFTKSKRDLRTPLNEHVGKITGRKNIALADMSCRYLTFQSEWWVFAAEFAVIAHYKPEWNYTGFGSKVPGARDDRARTASALGTRNTLDHKTAPILAAMILPSVTGTALPTWHMLSVQDPLNTNESGKPWRRALPAP